MKNYSFTRYEKEFSPELREIMNKSESSKELKETFKTIMKKFLNKAIEDIDFDGEDIHFKDEKPYYSVSLRLLDSDDFKHIWNNSDLPDVIGRMAETIHGHYEHLEKHPEKTEKKIRRGVEIGEK